MVRLHDNMAQYARRTSLKRGKVREGTRGMYGYVFLDELESPEVFDLPHSAFRVIVYLWAMAKKGEDVCWPSQKRIAERCNLSLRSVERAIAELERADLVVRLPHTGRSVKYLVCKPISLRQLGEEAA